jgi:cyclopropane fatty-acyl-phospholipid synthase-like methyltransferase
MLYKTGSTMSFYDDPDNVKKYIEMCEGYDGNNIYQLLSKHLSVNSTLLELGSGGGLDVEYLKKKYSVTGSDLSEEFLSVCKEKHPEISFLKLNAQKLELSEVFDCIYSNKVLHHLTKEALKESLLQQVKLLSNKGIIAHSFWIGEDNEEVNGLLFTYYNQEELLGIISESFEILSTLSYKEFEDGDSLFVIARFEDTSHEIIWST